jgi:hypothetical protein
MTGSASGTAEDRRAALIAAEKRAEKLFEEIEQQGLLRSGRTERQIEQDIFAIALQRFGVEKHWHKRFVRAGVKQAQLPPTTHRFGPSRRMILSM